MNTTRVRIVVLGAAVAFTGGFLSCRAAAAIAYSCSYELDVAPIEVVATQGDPREADLLASVTGLQMASVRRDTPFILCLKLEGAPVVIDWSGEDPGLTCQRLDYADRVRE